MFFQGTSSRLRSITVALAVLAFPCLAFAQHGGGGGHIGGTAAGGEGLSAGNHASGVDNKDDLRDFHEIMAVQASNEQKAAYAAMLKSTRASDAELQGLIALLGKENNAYEVTPTEKRFQDAIEIARTLNKRFLEGFSEAQKNGLKEITKRLGKVDAELAQQAKTLDQEVGVKATGAPVANSAQNLEHTLTSFEHAQADLGEEMSIAASIGPDTAFNLPAVKNTVNLGGHGVVVTTSAIISKAVPESGENTFAVKLTSDMSDLQQSITDILRAQLDKAEPCGERIEVQTADFTPQAATGLVAVQLHYERWTCATTFGRQNMNEIVEGNGTIEVKLTPAVAEDGTLLLRAEIGRVDAEGLVGELLRTGVVGEGLRDKISDSVLSALRQGGDFKAALPAQARTYATLRKAQFQGTGSGRLIALFEGDIRVSNENLTALTNALQERSNQAAGEMPRPELVAR
jgi:hypothetical protein